ncbi:acyl-CoA dehydrogenase family protein [Denitromonas iodatirespirans]|uniref:3-methylmercaptopropionyl-CoA dehydrogenase n=1 Tax=Denitromonas iodatirespirans TaxID=2795389 RepID=A0A944DJE2_DENI1|nr:acyl-CoA dehydrogenase family protein [Denitromonas iodatirespirans]MBT0964023.1 acyl-CoA dehydrogenase family protein [Denitromonas iodatirespirans]
MIDYRAPTAELLFAMVHGAGARRLANWDEDIAAQVLHEAARFIEAQIAPLDPVGDAAHAALAEGRVRLPPAFVDAYRHLRDAGWTTLSADEAWGGQALPEVLGGAVTEMLAGACVALQMVLTLGPAAVRAIAASGSPAQQARYLPRLVSGQWLATMCLTEAQAGSDLSTTRTLAEPAGDGSYRLRGEKIFISGGDHDLTENILHLVLARTPGAPAGVKGLSLFLCPAVREDGTRNAVACLRLEEKMGMHASPTCQLVFDGAHAEMLGAEGQGLAGMFVMMNAQRIETALQGVGLAEVAAQRSRAYAAQRHQGRLPGESGAVAINRHADVRRMLLQQMVLAQGCRAMVYRTQVELTLGQTPALVDFMTPVCKAFASEAGFEVAHLAIQIHGGYGYLNEYRVEQVLRDVRITSIYEGTNGIQATTLVERLLRQPDGAPAAAFAADVEAAIGVAQPAMAAALRTALAAWQTATDAALVRVPLGAATTGFMRLTGLVALGAAWARMEAAAHSAPNPQRTLAAAQYLRDEMLPECRQLADTVCRGCDLGALTDAVFAPE